MKNPADVMPAVTARLFIQFDAEPLLDSFILIGGTALALHIGHRKSEDLDYITLLPKLPRAALLALAQKLEASGHTVIQNDNPEAADDFENAGMDLKDHSQNFLIDGNVKITFFTADSHHAKILAGDPETAGNNGRGPGLATLEQLSQLKAIVAAARSKSRDWLDLYFLEKNHGFGLAQWRQAYLKAGLTDSHLETALNRICSGVVAADDEGFDTLLPDPPTVGEISNHFKALRGQYELNLAQQKLKER